MTSQISEQLIREILEGALSPSNQLRNSAEAKILSLANQDLGQFLFILSGFIPAENEKQEIRQIAATLIKNLLSKSQYSEKWFCLLDSYRRKVKSDILSTLASKEGAIRRAAAVAVAGICSIEIPQKQWLDIFDTLAGTSQNENKNIQLSSITTLQYIFEQVEDLSCLGQDVIAKVLNAFNTVLSRSTPDLTIATLKAIASLLPFMRAFLSDQNQAMLFFGLVARFLVAESDLVRRHAALVFIEIVRWEYDSFANFAESLITATLSQIKKETEENVILLIEIWCSVGDVEFDRIKKNDPKKPNLGILEKFKAQLGEVSLMYIQTRETQTDSSNTPKRSAFYLIVALSQCCTVQIIDSFLAFSGKKFQGDDYDKHAAFDVLRAIIESRHRDRVFNALRSSLVMIVDVLINSKTQEHLMQAAAEVLCRFVAVFGEDCVKDEDGFRKLLVLCVNLLGLNGLSNKVLYIIINYINFLAKSVHWSQDDDSNILSKFIGEIVEKLLAIGQNPKNYSTDINIPMTTFVTIGTLAERIAKDIKYSMIVFFGRLLDLFQACLNVKYFNGDSNIRDNYQDYISSSLIGFLTSGAADKDSVVKLLDYTILSFSIRKETYEQGISLIGSIALFLGSDFSDFIGKCKDYVKHALEMTDAKDICRSGVLCLSEIIRGMENKFEPYVQEYLIEIIKILNDQNSDRQIKPLCLNIISDLFVSCPNKTVTFFEQIMSVLGAALQAAGQKIDISKEDEENIQYFYELREHLVETLTCVFSIADEYKLQQKLVPYVKTILGFLFNINNLDSPEEIRYDILKQSVLFIADLSRLYGKELRAVLDLNWAAKLYEKLKTSKEAETDNEIGQLLTWVGDQLYNISK